MAALPRAGDRRLLLLWCTPLRGLKGASEQHERASSRPYGSQGHHPPPRSPGNRGASWGKVKASEFSAAPSPPRSSRSPNSWAGAWVEEQIYPDASTPAREHPSPGVSPSRSTFTVGGLHDQEQTLDEEHSGSERPPTRSILRRGRYAVPGATPHPRFRQPSFQPAANRRLSFLMTFCSFSLFKLL